MSETDWTHIENILEGTAAFICFLVALYVVWRAA